MTRKTVAQATLKFLDGWREVQEGEIVRGGRLILEYDSQRLPVCRFHVSSLARWDISVEGRFWPGGKSFAYTWPGREIMPSTILDPPYAVDVPDDATEVEMWFKNTDERPGGCLTWDSRFGRNYLFRVVGESLPA